MRLPVIMLIVLYVIALLIDFYILSDIRYSGREKNRKPLFPFREYYKTAPWLWIYSSVACLTLLTVAICLPRRDGASLHPIMWMLFIFLAIYIAKLGYLIGSLLGRIPRLWRGRRFDTRLWIGLPLAILLAFTFFWGAFYTRRHIEINEVTIDSSDLPKAFDGYKIVQFSDTHVDTWGNDTSFISKLVKTINEQNPDLIVFTGDIVSRQTSELIPFVEVFKKLKAKDGVYSILGNHDYGDYLHWPSDEAKAASLEELKLLQQQMGWKMLNNSLDTIRRGNEYIVIAGVENWGEPPFKQYGDLQSALPKESENPEDFVILLSHNPMHWHEEVSKNDAIDLTLSGHTHAMQTQLSLGNWRWSPSQWRYPEWSGLYKAKTPSGKDTELYVNIGAGEVGVPARFGTSYPEVTVFTLKSTSPHQDKTP